jgi:hypothetical protein
MDMDFRDDMSRYMDAKQEERSPLVGPSSTGSCIKQLAYRYNGTPKTDVVSKDRADLGTLLHLGWSQMIRSMFAPEDREPDVRLEWDELPRSGEADDVDWANRVVTDLKTANGRSWQAMVDRGEPYDKYWDQVEMYALSLSRSTHDDWRIRIVLLNTETGVRYEFERPADPVRGKALVDELADRHARITASMDAGEEPDVFDREGKGPGRGFPCDWCEWATACWPGERDGMSPQAVTIVDNPELIAEAAASYRTGMEMESAGKKIKSDSAAFLKGITGTFGDWKVAQVPDGREQSVPDEQEMLSMLSQAGMPIPMVTKAGRRGYPRVSRLTKE